ncbi:hypothetical protein AB1N83_009319 [Pleurotus pulmonarius]
MHCRFDHFRVGRSGTIVRPGCGIYTVSPLKRRDIPCVVALKAHCSQRDQRLSQQITVQYEDYSLSPSVTRRTQIDVRSQELMQPAEALASQPKCINDQINRITTPWRAVSDKSL